MRARRCERSPLKNISSARDFLPVQARNSPRGCAIRGPTAPGFVEDCFRSSATSALPEMDAAGIDVQVLSLNSPGVEQAEVAEQIAISRESNDFLAEAVKKHPTRFAGLGILADRGARQGGRRAGAPGSAAGLQGHAHQWPHARPLSGRQVLLADLGARRSAECPDLSAPDHSAEGGRRGVVRRLCSRRDGDVRRPQAGAGTSRPRFISFGMILGGVFDRHPKLQIVDRPPGRRHSVHAAAAPEELSHAADQA